MRFPIEFYEIIFWIAEVAIILLATSEILNSYYGRTNLLITRDRLKNIAITTFLIFLFMIISEIYRMI